MDTPKIKKAMSAYNEFVKKQMMNRPKDTTVAQYMKKVAELWKEHKAKN